jgi:hypothetical protein
MARRIYSGRQTMLNGTRDEIEQTVRQFKPEPGAEDFARKQQLFTQLRDQANSILDERATDPAAYAKKLPDVQQKYQQVNRGQATLEEAISYNLARQKQLGIPRGQRRAIVKDEAQRLVQEVQAAPPAERAKAVADLQRDYGKHFDEVFMDMQEAGLDPINQLLLSTVGDRSLSQEVVSAIELGPSELKKPLSNDAVDTIDSVIEDNVRDFRQAHAATDFTGGATENLNAILDGVKQVAMLRAQRQDPTTAAKRAVRDLVTGKFHIVNDPGADQGLVGGSVDASVYDAPMQALIPRTLNGRKMDPARIQAAASLKLEREELERFDPAPDAMPAGTPEFLGKERLIRTAMNSGTWVTNEDNTGVFLMLPDQSGAQVPMVNDAGERYELSYAEAMRMDISEAVPDPNRGTDVMGRDPRTGLMQGSPGTDAIPDTDEPSEPEEPTDVFGRNPQTGRRDGVGVR